MTRTVDPRTRLIRLLHVGRRELQLDEDTYRDMLQAITGKRSSKELSVPQLERVLSHLKSRGFRVKGAAAGQRPVATDPTSRKIRAIWIELHQAGAVRDPSERSLAAFVRRQTGCEALQWLTTVQASAVIESLKKWLERAKRQAKEAVQA